MLQLRLSQGVVDPAFKEYLAYYDGLLFFGRVTKKKKVKDKTLGLDSYDYKVTFKVHRYWKGADSAEVVVFTSAGGGGSCGFRFRKGDEYLVFASEIRGRMETNICNLTAHALYAPNIVKGLYLGEGKIPTITLPQKQSSRN